MPMRATRATEIVTLTCTEAMRPRASVRIEYESGDIRGVFMLDAESFPIAKSSHAAELAGLFTAMAEEMRAFEDRAVISSKPTGGGPQT